MINDKSWFLEKTFKLHIFSATINFDLDNPKPLTLVI